MEAEWQAVARGSKPEASRGHCGPARGAETVLSSPVRLIPVAVPRPATAAAAGAWSLQGRTRTFSSAPCGPAEVRP